jgi:hypothetical protein
MPSATGGIVAPGADGRRGELSGRPDGGARRTLPFFVLLPTNPACSQPDVRLPSDYPASDGPEWTIQVARTRGSWTPNREEPIWLS